METALFAQVARRFSTLAPSSSPLDWPLTASEATALLRKATVSRLAFAMIAALITLPVAPKEVLLGWAGFIAAWELLLRPALEDAIHSRPDARGDGFRALAVLHFVGACGYVVFPATAWSTGTAVGMVIATAWVAATAIHAFTYFAQPRLLLCATLAPLTGGMLLAMSTTDFAVTPLSAVGMLVMAGVVLAGGLVGQDRKELVLALARAQSRREAAEAASAAKSRFMALMSHELRTPLNAVIGYAELIEQDAPSPVAEDARRILKAAHRQLDLVNNVLDLARLESGDVTLHPARVRGEAVLDAVRRAGAPLAEARANRFTVQAVGDLGDVVLDVERLHAAVMHLVSNAAKFTENGEIAVTARRDGDLFSVTVADTGPGIDPARTAALFEPFAQGDGSSTRAYEGAGLGLAIARLAARRMGGDLACESRPGAGATFTLTVAAGR